MPRARYHTVAKGDTLYSISRNYNVDITTLSKLNNLSEPYTLGIGQKLALPASVGTNSYRQTSAPTPVKVSQKPSHLASPLLPGLTFSSFRPLLHAPYLSPRSPLFRPPKTLCFLTFRNLLIPNIINGSSSYHLPTNFCPSFSQPLRRKKMGGRWRVDGR